MKNWVWMVLAGLIWASCDNEEIGNEPHFSGRSQAVFRLYERSYDGVKTRAAAEEKGDFDRVEYYIMDKDNRPVTDIKSAYFPSTSEIVAEGLQEGDYTLLVLSIKGDMSKDEATIHTLKSGSDLWLAFPENLERPLQAEYFYSRTPFRVETKNDVHGTTEVVTLEKKIEQRRIVGRADFLFHYGNPYVRGAVTAITAHLTRGRFYTSFAADSVFSGSTNGRMQDLKLDAEAGYLFMPTVPDESVEGDIRMESRRYTGERVQQDYQFAQAGIGPNLLTTVETRVTHPDDRSGTLFVTRTIYNEGDHGKILQDGEPSQVYFDARQRSFNTAKPLQVNVTEEGQLHLRFYSPRDLGHVKITARVPSLHNEFLDFAYFDTIPAFADIFLDMPFTSRKAVYRTESGKYVEVPQVKAADIGPVEFRIESTEDYWKKLQGIRHGWTITYNAFGGNPDATDGAPVGNWMGIRPVHCREVVAFFLNFTYMIDMDEHEEILRANEDKLYGNGGPTDKVTVEKVLEQMRQERTLKVGLVYPGNGVLGLGSPGVYGAYQQAYLQHYFNTYSCEVMFHELGHVMGYSHSSAFTYGPWAQELMNHFYVNNLSKFPIDSKEYLKSSENPNLY